MSNLCYNQEDWNGLWASAQQMERAWEAIDRGDLATLKDCFKRHPKIYRWRRLDGYNFLAYFALASNPDPKLLEFLLSTPMLDEREDVQANFSECLAILCHDGGSLKAAEQLLAHGADPNFEAGVRDSPLILAVRRNRLDLVSLLLNHGANPNYRGLSAMTPLEIAQQESYVDIASLLLQCGKLAEPIPRRVLKRKTKFTSVTLNLDQQQQRLQKLFATAICRWRRSSHNPLGSIGVTCSGVRGFVSVSVNENRFQPYAPDCCNQFMSTIDVTIADWKKAFKTKDRIFVARAGRTEKRLTLEAARRTIEQPFFDFVRDEFLKALKTGVLADVDVSHEAVFGCQSHYFHHCTCWDYRFKKVEIPRVWDKSESIKAQHETTTAEAASRLPSRPSLIIRKSACEILCDPFSQQWLLQNSAGVNRIPFGKTKVAARMPNSRILGIDLPGETRLMCAETDERAKIWVESLSSNEHVSSDMAIDLASYAISCASNGRASWILTSHSDMVTVGLGAKHILRLQRLKHNAQNISNSAMHGASSRVAYNEFYDTTLVVSKVRGQRLEVEIARDLTSILGDIQCIHDISWHPSGFALAVVFCKEDESDHLALLDAEKLSLLASGFIGNDVHCDALEWSPDGRYLAVNIKGDHLGIAAGMLATRDNLVIFDKHDFGVLGVLPVQDVSCYAWHADSTQLLVGGYKESTLWDIDSSRSPVPPAPAIQDTLTLS